MNTEKLHSSYITGTCIDETFGKYRMSCKVGTYCLFGFDQVSNQRHQHDCYELCVVIEGKGNFLYGNTVHKLQKGDVIMAEPGVGHEIQADAKENLLLVYIFIEIKDNHRTAAGKSYGEKCIDGFLKGHGQKTSQEHLLAYLEFIEAYNSPKRKIHFGTYEALKNLVLESLVSLSDNSGSPPVEIAKNILENSLDYIDANLHKKMLVKDIAANCCTTPRNLEYLFRKHIGKTVVGYMNEKKMALACHYLDMYFSITDTANFVGIGSSSQFSTLFKKYKAISPKQYQLAGIAGIKSMGRRL